MKSHSSPQSAPASAREDDSAGTRSIDTPSRFTKWKVATDKTPLDTDTVRCVKKIQMTIDRGRKRAPSTMHRDDHADAASAAPPYDIWRRTVPGTSTYLLVVAAIEATADVRRRSTGSAPPRRRRSADQKMYETMADAVVSSLVHRELTLPGGWTRVPLAHQRTGGGGTRYRSPAMSRSLPGFVYALAELGWLELHIGHMGRKEQVQSIMRATPALVSEMQRLGCKLADFARDPAEEVIVLKGRKPTERDGRGRRPAAPWIDYTDTPETDRLRAELHEVNAWLASAPLDYTEPGRGADPVGDRRLYRVFNNGSFDEGGRLAGGFWSTMSMCPEKARSRGNLWRGHIRIAGEPIVAVDFVSMFIRLLYVKAGVQPPQGDLLAGIEGQGPEHREGIKKVMYALLFSEGSLSRLPQHTRVLLRKGTHVRTLEKNIRQRHPPVAHLLGTGVGMRLFRLESDIVLEVLRLCRAEELWALPVHDAILVAESRAEDAKRVMLAAFEAVTGFRGEVGEPKRPGGGAADLDTMPENMEDDGADFWRVKDLIKDGHREAAAQILTTYQAKRNARRPPEAPTSEADWR